jgi:hypothetical protein
MNYQRMFRMLSGVWEVEAYGSLSMSFSMSMSMSLSMPTTAVPVPAARRLLEVVTSGISIANSHQVKQSFGDSTMPKRQLSRRLSVVVDEKIDQSIGRMGQVIFLVVGCLAVLLASILVVIESAKRKRAAKSITFHDHQIILISHGS